MVIWRNVVKGIIKASLPTIILPAIIIGVVIKYFGLTLDSLLAILFLGELYIVWAQLEVALRQTRLSLLEYEAEFKIETKEDVQNIQGKISRFFNLRLVNVGKHLVRNVYVSIDVKGNQNESVFIPFTNIAPNEPVYLYTFDEDTFRNNRVTVNVDYENAIGELNGVTFVKEPKLSVFIVIKQVRMPGLLLNSFEDLIRIWHLFMLPRKVKKLQKGES